LPKGGAALLRLTSPDRECYNMQQKSSLVMLATCILRLDSLPSKAFPRRRS